MTAVATPQVGNRSPDVAFRPQLRPLDGMRGLGIIVVLLYHQAFTWFPNGVLVISMFFTLSGYLLARLAVREADTHGAIDVGRFFTRRFRRLMPAALAVITAVAALSWLWPGDTRPLRFRDVLSGVTYWENWNLFAADSRYEEATGIASPLLHLWSLSIEEQVFVVFPFVMMAVLLWPRTRRWAGWALAAACVAGFALGPWFEARRGVSGAYYATPVRLAEFLTGVLVAVVVGRRPQWLAVARQHAGRLGWQILAGVLVVTEIGVWVSFGLLDAGLFPWGVLASSLLTAAIMIVAETDALASRALSWKPICWLGVRVYGLYLVHFPVYRFVDEGLVGVGGARLFVVRVAITLAISEALYRCFEDPIRRGSMWPGRRLFYGCAALVPLALVAGALADGRQPQSFSEAARIQQATLAGLPQVPFDAPTRSSIDPRLPARVLIIGDSQSLVLAGGLGEWAEANGVWVEYHAGVGCGIGGVTPIRYLGIEYDAAPGCDEWADYRPRVLERFRPNLVVVIGGLGDLSDRRVPGVDGWTHIGEPAYDSWLQGEFDGFVTEATSTGASVMWLTHPDVAVPFTPGGTGDPPFIENQPERMAAYNTLISTQPDRHPEVRVADFASVVRALPGGQFDPEVRPDGTHFDFSAAPSLIDWVTQQLVAPAGTDG